MIETLKRFGITTGGSAASASKAAVIWALTGVKQRTVVIPTPIGLRIEVPVSDCWIEGEERCCMVNKFSGDNPDVLNGVEIVACISLRGEEIKVVGGSGVGLATRDGLKVSKGEAAINPIAKQMIIDAIREVWDKGAIVEVKVPRGEELANQTMNPIIGIKGGISILGTTGIESPVSDEDYIEHIRCELNVMKGEWIVLAMGNTSVDYSRKRFGERVVKIGDRIGDSLKLAEELGFRKIILVGQPGKMSKVAAGIFNTHNRFGDSRIESLVYACVIAGIPSNLLTKVASALSVEEGLHYLGDLSSKVIRVIAERSLFRLSHKFHVSLGIVVIGYSEEVLAEVGDTSVGI
ncbi:cobalt-precorrin-5B (C(1))-methyltransferase CbiD [Acidianus sp. RZ1]|uniref:cobalt-precorrin-5B (C(1))-methyltransferase CbiD n=1 Tax=Acidianus sp. RZ1 TaxID=1540082 RepID=UPI001491BD2D|nr:cobalt-precorrin-5B (C(1))-methyltransferase CbiD [Acidianus sp. RZ1]